MAESTSPKKTKTKTTVLSINQRLEQLDQQIEWFYGDEFSREKKLKKVLMKLRIKLKLSIAILVRNRT